MQPLIKSYISKHTPPIISMLIAICGGTAYIADIVNSNFTSMRSSLIAEARAPFYLSTEYALLKQNEKIDKSPGDIKTTDIEYLSVMCQDDFGESYVPALPTSRRIDMEVTCGKMVNLYKTRVR
jgi:hypothetical protein